MFISLVLLLFVKYIVYGQIKSDRLIALKRKTSEILKLEGVQFDGDINKVNFIFFAYIVCIVGKKF